MSPPPHVQSGPHSIHGGAMRQMTLMWTLPLGSLWVRRSTWLRPSLRGKFFQCMPKSRLMIPNSSLYQTIGKKIVL
eukprot:6482086-Amphidinium_carterae.1